MARVILGNAFSLNMVPQALERFMIGVVKITPSEVKQTINLAAEFIPAIGHHDTANVVISVLGLEGRYAEKVLEGAQRRPTITLQDGDRLIVAQYRGPRLPEGSTTLPPGATLEFYLVQIA
jgi:hypothetical protein